MCLRRCVNSDTFGRTAVVAICLLMGTRVHILRCGNDFSADTRQSAAIKRLIIVIKQSSRSPSQLLSEHQPKRKLVE